MVSIISIELAQSAQSAVSCVHPWTHFFHFVGGSGLLILLLELYKISESCPFHNFPSIGGRLTPNSSFKPEKAGDFSSKQKTTLKHYILTQNRLKDEPTTFSDCMNHCVVQLFLPSAYKMHYQPCCGSDMPCSKFSWLSNAVNCMFLS